MPDLPRHISFGYNKWRQKPLKIGTPAGVIEISRTQGYSVRVDISADGERWADHVGRLVLRHADDGRSIIVELEHEEREREA